MPAEAGIQYAAASRLEHSRLWNTGSSAFADDDNGACGCLKIESQNVRLSSEQRAAADSGAGAGGLLFDLRCHSCQTIDRHGFADALQLRLALFHRVGRDDV